MNKTEATDIYYIYDLESWFQSKLDDEGVGYIMLTRDEVVKKLIENFIDRFDKEVKRNG
jgi:hypothetical protein